MVITDKKIVFLVLSLVVINLAAWAGYSYNAYTQNRNLQNIGERLSSLENSASGTGQNSISKEQFDALVERSKGFSQQVDSVLKAYAGLQDKSLETVKQEIAKQKSQDEMLTEAVAKCPHCFQFLIDPPVEVDYHSIDKKKCVYCGKKILAEAKFCKFCQKWLDALDQTMSDFDNIE